MLVRHQPLLTRNPCTQRQLISLHYGQPGGAGKVYLQASLHADELPGMLALHHLRLLLDEAEARGEILGEIVLVPIANPIGLEQTLMHDAMGRFDFNSGENFNRRYPDLAQMIQAQLGDELNDDPQHNLQLIRRAMAAALHGMLPGSELDSLRQAQLLLAHDADFVLDLHCDAQAVVHLYGETPYQAQLEPLARYIGAQATLLASGTGAGSFDEACGQPWWRLAQQFANRFPIPSGCVAATVELRGEAQVEHPLASQDAAALYAFLQHRGLLAGTAPPLPALLQPVTPFDGSLTLRAPCAGLVVFLHSPGAWIEREQPVVHIIDPISGTTQVVCSTTSGVMYMRSAIRFAAAGVELCKVAGAVPLAGGVVVSA
ncbi:succinylglutamate desuccinylase [Pseudomonas sp. S04]|uniref:succinylglutamate desuccinylase/aspartoacylase family protein n=1 Tax=unclassified Pseudomonas TaxID=196821 RepID=UPI0013201958|nr:MULTISPECIES: succinylglutamate desuccinylase/aspartoacylase family protein [unclassified Pseudomonas]QHD00094.1 succinylglutamate desuccinylase [Pseudomonas sp. S04]QHF32577.1 succinylglutamate desuccinylase [Pseudomonas sp. S19]